MYPAADTDPDGTVVAASITLSGTPVGGTVQFNVPAAGFVRFIPNQSLVGTGSFSYTVRDNAGAVSNVATVTVTVNRETLAVTAASAQLRGTTGADWDVSGTTNVPRITTAPNTTTPNVITVFANANPDGTGGTRLGTATPDNRGRWSLSLRNSPILPTGNSMVTATSTLGNSQTRSVTVR